MAVDEEFVFAAVADERREIAALIDGLDDAQLATQSLCAGWDVKTVAAHLVSDFADVSGGFRPRLSATSVSTVVSTRWRDAARSCRPLTSPPACGTAPTTG
jgi:uncharacterized protein (TIGR03083 family)